MIVCIFGLAILGMYCLSKIRIIQNQITEMNKFLNDIVEVMGHSAKIQTRTIESISDLYKVYEKEK